MPRLSGDVSEQLFAAVDAWREQEMARHPGSKWSRQGAIEYLTLCGLREMGKVDPAVRKVLAAVKDVRWERYDARKGE